jgi:cullin 1
MDEALLSYYTKQWVKYTTAARVVNNIFMYLNRYWVKREIDEDRKSDIYDIFTVSIYIFFCFLYCEMSILMILSIYSLLLLAGKNICLSMFTIT